MSDPTPSPPAPSAEIEALNQLVAAQAARIAILEEQLRLAVHQRFAPKSEKSSPLDQPDLFNEAEVAAPEASPDEPGATEITVPEHTRLRGKRKPIDAVARQSG